MAHKFVTRKAGRERRRPLTPPLAAQRMLPYERETLDVLGSLHAYGIARRIEQISGDLLAVNQGTLYPVLLRLEQEGSIVSQWGTSENNRRARFYRLTRSGQKALQSETRDWRQTVGIIDRFFSAKAEDFE